MASSTKSPSTPKRPRREPESVLPLDRRSVAWRVNTEPTVILGGGRALLLQVAHPSIATGVEQHSAYKHDPWGRLFGTLHVVMKMMFGSPEESRRHQDLLEHFHQGIVGDRDDGTAYRALDPALLLWVWATLIDTAVDLYERCVGPLSDADRDRYYQESKGLAYAVGAPVGGCPEDWSAFEAYFAKVVAEDLRVLDPARAVALAVLAPPFPFGLDRVVSLPQKLVTAGLLPPSVRELYGFDWTPEDQRRFDAFFASARLASRLTVEPARRLPAAFTLRLRKPLHLPVLEWMGGRIISARLSSAGFAV